MSVCAFLFAGSALRPDTEAALFMSAAGTNDLTFREIEIPEDEILMALRYEPRQSDEECDQRRRWVDVWRSFEPGYNRGVPKAVSLRALSAELRLQITETIPDIVDCKSDSFERDIESCVFTDLASWPLEWQPVFCDVLRESVIGSSLCPLYCRQVVRISGYIRHLKEDCRPETVNPACNIRPEKNSYVSTDAALQSVLDQTLTSAERARGVVAPRY